jgi:hypothetical protein
MCVVPMFVGGKLDFLLQFLRCAAPYTSHISFLPYKSCGALRLTFETGAEHRKICSHPYGRTCICSEISEVQRTVTNPANEF